MQIKVIDSELEQFPVPEDALSCTLLLKWIIKQELWIPTLHQVYKCLITGDST